MIATLVPADEADAVWDHAAPLLREALARGRDYDIADAWARVTAGMWGLWIVARRGEMVGACLTEIVRYPTRRVLWIVAAGGAMRDAAAALWPLLRACAEQHECAAVQWQGRRGWGRSGVLPEGWRHVADVMEVEV